MVLQVNAIPYEEAIASVKARVAASRTSFHAGMALLPRERREAMFALYAFCRDVDDIADGDANVPSIPAALDDWRKRIHALFTANQVSDPITAALAPAIVKYKLAEEDFQAIIDGMAMDAGEPIVAPDAATLDLYCDRVASAVGRASVRIFGDDSENAMTLSYHLGRAFQLTNILRDIAEDAARGRLYLPSELLNANGIATRDLSEVIRHPNLPALCRTLATQAQDHFAHADAAMAKGIASAMKPARIMRSYYGAIFERLVVEDWRDVTKRVSLPQWQKLYLMLRAALGIV